MSELSGRDFGGTLPQDATLYMESLHGVIEGVHFTAAWATIPRSATLPNEDAVYAFVDPHTQIGVFGLFDGMGGYDDGEVAAQAARQELHDIQLSRLGQFLTEPTMQLQEWFQAMNDRVLLSAPLAGTTATVTILYPLEGSQELLGLCEGAAGDSLDYLVMPNDEDLSEIIQLNKEEGMGRDVYNALGANFFVGLSQSMLLDFIQSGDILVKTTDGITGDNDSQRLPGGNEETILDLSSNPDLSPAGMAELLIQIAKKPDDRTAMVVKIL